MGAPNKATVVVDGLPVFFRSVPGDGPPAVFVHGNPTHSADWLPFLERIAGPALAPDLPGFGRTPLPPGFHGTMHGHADLFERFLEQLGVGRHSLVVHDWGALALIAEQRRPQLLHRLVVINSVPLLPGYRWHWIARLWRRRGVGELLHRLWSRPGMRLELRRSRGDRKPMPASFVDLIWEALDSEMRAAILQLYRSAPEPELAAAGAQLDRLRAPALVVWGGRDPYLGPEQGRAYAERLPNAELLELPALGHWPWREDPAVVDRVLDFLGHPVNDR
jgi:pimeloyl-ACP methyl ester carboxylesterase